MGRDLTFHIFRYNPQNPNSQPHLQDFSLEETEGMTLFIVLNRIQEEQDPTLQFDFCCRAGMCGSCAILINGRPDLACHTKTIDLPQEITLLPLPVFDLVGDLSVDKGKWFRKLNERVESWVHTENIFDPSALEERMDNQTAVEIYELERCIECGCCIAVCGTAEMCPDFLGAAALNRIARFMVDPRDQRKDQDYFELVGSDEEIFGCLSLPGKEDICPKNLPLQDQLSLLRRKVGWGPLKELFKKKGDRNE